MYPVTNYSLEVKELSPGSDVKSFESLTNLIITTDLVEDAIYMLQITVWNSVGSVSSDNKLVCKFLLPLHSLHIHNKSASNFSIATLNVYTHI